MPEVALEVRNLSKAFPGVQALSDISIAFEQGSVHALVGENGAGKSTLGKIIAGLYQPDAGHILVNGQEVSFKTPIEAQKHGIGIVHQELLFCENLSVADNLSLGKLPSTLGFVDERAAHQRAKLWLTDVGCDIDPNVKVGALPVAQQQLIQIASTIGQGANIIIFDEPTSSLSQLEVVRLLDRIRKLRDQGKTCIYVSHRLEEIFAVCDHVSVLRDGQLVGTRDVSEIDRNEIVRMMVGREVHLGEPIPPTSRSPLATVNDVSLPGKLKSVSFEIRPGEILGLAGLVGSGRTEILESIFGLNSYATGSVKFGRDRAFLPYTTEKVMSFGVGLVPEDRKRHGLVLGMKIRENTTLPILDLLSKLGFIAQNKEREASQEWFDKLDVRATSPESVVGSLSGGNQQKVVIARWLAKGCEILLVDEPTRGVDIGAKAEIHMRLQELAQASKAVVVVSSELPELRALASRILVFRDGSIVAELPASASEEEIMSYMAGTAEPTKTTIA